MTPMKAIRAKCLDCMCGSAHEVRLCPCVKCPLYAYRFGKRPKMGNDTAEDTNGLNAPPSPHVEGLDNESEVDKQ